MAIKKVQEQRKAPHPTSTKLAISLERELASEVARDARKRAGGNVSAWLAEAAKERLRLQAMTDAIEAFEAEHGKITEEEMKEAERLWPGV